MREGIEGEDEKGEREREVVKSVRWDRGGEGVGRGRGRGVEE